MNKQQIIYLSGSLRNPEIPIIANRLRNAGYEVFDDWFSAGPEADDYLQKYENGRGYNFSQALNGWAVEHIYQFDRKHIDRSDIVILVLPAGKSTHLELGYAIGRGKKGYIVYGEEPERFDVMYRFADGIFVTIEELLEELRK